MMPAQLFELPRRIVREYRDTGPRQFTRNVRDFIRYYPEKVRTRHIGRSSRAAALEFDQEHNVDTAGTIKLLDLEVMSETKAHGNPYQGIDHRKFEAELTRLGIDFGGHVFIDIGSGKGKAVLLASRYCFDEVVGIEFSRELHDVAVANLASYQDDLEQHAPISLACEDALAYEFPEKPTVCLMYNTFDGDVMEPMMEHIERSLKAAPRPFVILYWNPVWHDILDRQSFLQHDGVMAPVRVYRSILT